MSDIVDLLRELIENKARIMRTPGEFAVLEAAVDEIVSLRSQVAEKVLPLNHAREIARLDTKVGAMRMELDGLMAHQAQVHRDLIESLDRKDRAITRLADGWNNRLKFGAPVDVIERERAEIELLRKEIG